MIEAQLVQPEHFPAFAFTLHGLFFGMLCFLTGFLFISLKDEFWQAVQRLRRKALAVAFLLFLVRLFLFRLEGPNALIAFESMSWMLAVFGFASVYLNKPSARLAYLSSAVYPVYILHMPLQFFFSYYIMALSLLFLLHHGPIPSRHCQTVDAVGGDLRRELCDLRSRDQTREMDSAAFWHETAASR